MMDLKELSTEELIALSKQITAQSNIQIGIMNKTLCSPYILLYHRISPSASGNFKASIGSMILTLHQNATARKKSSRPVSRRSAAEAAPWTHA